MLNVAQELLDFHRHSHEAVAAHDSAGHEMPLRNTVAQQKQRNMTKIAIFLELRGNDFSVTNGAGEIDHNPIGPKPTGSMNSKSGIVFFADGILARTFKSVAER